MVRRRLKIVASKVKRHPLSASLAGKRARRCCGAGVVNARDSGVLIADWAKPTLNECEIRGSGGLGLLAVRDAEPRSGAVASAVTAARAWWSATAAAATSTRAKFIPIEW